MLLLVAKAKMATGRDYDDKITELEKQVVKENMAQLRCTDELKTVTAQMRDLKAKYNEAVRQRADAQGQLVKTEEAKLATAKSAIELQIENTKLQEQLQDKKFSQNTEALNEDIDSYKLAGENAALKKTMAQLQANLEHTADEKKDLEYEFMTLKKNFMEKCAELETERGKMERSQLDSLSKGIRVPVSDSQSRDELAGQVRLAAKLQSENSDLRAELLSAKTATEKARNDKSHAEIELSKARMEIDSRMLELDKLFLSGGAGAKGAVSSKDLLEMKLRVKKAERDLEESGFAIVDLQEQLAETQAERADLAGKLDGVKSRYRNDLEGLAGEDVKDELIKCYAENEKSMKDENKKTAEKMALLRAKIKTLREYARRLKYVCEDLVPEGKPRPSILTASEPEPTAEEVAEQRNFAPEDLATIEELHSENTRLRLENQQLSSKVKKQKEIGKSAVKGTMDGGIQRQILEELKMLKEGRLAGGPGDSEEQEQLRKERTGLLEENRRLKQIVSSLFAFTLVDRARCGRASFGRDSEAA